MDICEEGKKSILVVRMKAAWNIEEQPYIEMSKKYNLDFRVYCRYCSLAVLNDDDLIYCEAKDEMREGKQIRNPNKCKHFEFNPVDVLDENKKYRPREQKKKNIEGQVSFL